MSRKKKKQEKQERLAIKDFFDRILPGVLKFYSDHYICGDSFRCVWAIREYPPSTEEQAILSQLADRSHIPLRIYNRLVDAAEQRKIIQNAKLRFSSMEEFFQAIDGLFLDKEAVKQNEDGTITLDFQNI